MKTSPKTDYDLSNRIADGLRDKMRDHGLEPDNLTSAVALGTSLNKSFPQRLGVDALRVGYKEAGLPHGTAPGHDHEAIIGPLDGDENHLTIAYSGRPHIYGGFTANECVRYVRVAKALGIDILGVTNAAGSLNPSEFPEGGIAMIRDMVRHGSQTPLLGTSEEMWGDPFTATADLLPEWIIDEARIIATGQVGWNKLPSGVYIQDQMSGRRYQTRAETTRFVRWGDMVGKSTVIELEAALDAGIPHHFGVTKVTNLAQGIEGGSRVTSDHVEKIGAEGADDVAKFLALLMAKIADTVREKQA
jgi:purine-nucleoside phosphorylase